ncbi:MAG: transcription termination factor Rho [Ilumatobacter sp.]
MAAEALEQSALEGKDKDQLLQIAKALGVKGVSKLKKADLVGKIIDATGGADAPSNGSNGAADPVVPEAEADGAARSDEPAATSEPETPVEAAPSTEAPPAEEPLADWEKALHDDGVSTETTEVPAPDADSPDSGRNRSGRDENGRRRNEQAKQGGSDGESKPNDGQSKNSDGQRDRKSDDGQGRNRNNQDRNNGGGNRNGGNNNPGGNGQGANTRNRDEEGGGNKRRRRRRKGGNRGQEGPQGDDVDLLENDNDTQSNEPVEVSGYLDIRDEGYGFLRIDGYLPSKQDAYISVRLSRQFGLRKGDQVTGMARPARGNEKNPQLIEVRSVNGGDPEKAKKRPRFENLTALFPDEKLRLEDPSDPSNMTARIIDLISPIGKGQRGIIVSPPKAGKTTIMKTIAKMIEKNNPEVKLIMLLVDERPEEVTDIQRSVRGEVISSTFDRPSDEHAAIAEMTIAKARRMVEDGTDVVIMLDGITRLVRAYNLAAPSSGKILSGGIDAGALYPPKKFFGAARNVEEGGSLTILATALVDTNSRMDEAIFEEFKGTGNMELRLDRKVAERRIYPAIDVDASSTRHEELLFDRGELQMVWKLRRVLSGLAADGNAAPGLELLMDRLKTFKSNSEFLSEIAKQPGM